MRSWTSGVAARFARMCSAPINSVVSLKMEQPPSFTSRSLSSPMTGLAARPLVGSLPPHSVPTISSDMGNSFFCSSDASAAISLA